MQNRPLPRRRSARLAPKFSVVVAFDNETTGSSAMKTCDYVIQQLGKDIVVRRKLIDFHVEPDAKKMAAAAREAAGADMVIVSTNEENQLTKPMEHWFEQWSVRRGAGEGALVAILNRDPNKKSPSGVRDQLESVARVAKMDFFSSEVAAT